jgi:glycosyltransferase involved in cell wall biosynthesis
MLRIISAPLFESRPELSILESIVDYVRERGTSYSLLSEGLYSVPVGGNVYDDLTMSRYYLKVTESIIHQVQNNDILLWIDAWNPAFPIIKHYAHATNITLYNYGIFHSNPLINGDYLQDSEWAVDFQEHLMKYMNHIFVASKYLKSFFTDKYKNISVTGLPITDSLKKIKLYTSSEKENVIVFNHRWAEDKRPQEFSNLAAWWSKNMKSKLEFRVLTPEKEIFEKLQNSILSVRYCDTKIKYFKELGKAKFIWANSILETFGYSIMEGYMSGAIPILNNMPCYKEFYPNSIYNNFEEQIDLILTAKYENIIFNYKDQSIKNMFNIIRRDSEII